MQSGSVELGANEEVGQPRSQDEEEETIEYIAPMSSAEVVDDPPGAKELDFIEIRNSKMICVAISLRLLRALLTPLSELCSSRAPSGQRWKFWHCTRRACNVVVSREGTHSGA